VRKHGNIVQAHVDAYNDNILHFASDHGVEVLHFERLARGHSDGGAHQTGDAYPRAAAATVDRLCW
jgi:hypothetical protein